MHVHALRRTVPFHSVAQQAYWSLIWAKVPRTPALLIRKSIPSLCDLCTVSTAAWKKPESCGFRCLRCGLPPSQLIHMIPGLCSSLISLRGPQIADLRTAGSIFASLQPSQVIWHPRSQLCLAPLVSAEVHMRARTVSKYYYHCCNNLPIFLIRSLHTCFTNSSPMPRFAPVTTHTVLAISLRAANDELAKCLRKSQGWNQRLDSLCCSVKVSTWSTQLEAHAVHSSRRMSTGVALRRKICICHHIYHMYGHMQDDYSGRLRI